jgi:AcrR family transcriptional regulator
MRPRRSTDIGKGAAAKPDRTSRNRLLRSAVEIFERKGYAAASVREIVEHAGVCKPVLYYYFGSKEGILVSILEAAAEELQAAIAPAVHGTASARTRIVQLCESVYAGVKARVSVARVAHGVYFGPPDERPPFDFHVFDRTLNSALRRIVHEGVVAGEFCAGATKDIAAAIQAMLILAIDQEVDGRSRPLGRAGLRRLLALLFEGVAARSGHKERRTS